MPIRVHDLVACNTKAKNVATEVYVDDSIDTVNDTINNISTAVTNANDALAQQLGYEDYANMKTAAVLGTTVINGGYIDTALIDTNSLTVKNVSVNEGSTGAHLAINNDVIKAYDDNGILRVKLGNLNT
jgi:hypothetical protein